MCIRDRDYIEGESLDKILNEYGAQPEELVITWAKQLCDALSYLHSQKPPIIYRETLYLIFDYPYKYYTFKLFEV